VRLLPAAGRVWVAVLVSLYAVQAVLVPAEIAVTGWLIGAIPGALAAGSGTAEAAEAYRAVAALGAVLVAGQVVGPAVSLVRSHVRRRVDGTLLARSQRALNRPVGLGHLHDPAVLDRLNLGGGAGSSNVFAPASPGEAAVGVIGRTATVASALLAGLILLRVSWPSAVAVLLASAAARRHGQRHHAAMYRRFKDLAGDYRRAGYTSSLATMPAAAKETRVFGLGDWLIDRYRRQWGEVTSQMAAVRADVRARTVRSYGLMAVAQAGVFVHLGLLAADGLIGVGTLTAALWGSLRLGSLAFFTSDDLRVEQGLVSLDAVEEIEGLSAAAARAETLGTRPAAGLPRGTIRFEAVCFSYPGQDRPVLDGLDLEVPAGSSLAIVGANGAGKTTLVKLLARLYQPSAGRVTVDGTDVADLDPAAWRRQLAVIFQDFARYELAAADNVGFGALALRPDREALERAAARAGALSIVEGLPAGWDTPLSRQQPGGVDLSGGEWQRVALARALLAVDAGARVLVLDEPTANLDVRAEVELFDRFLELTAGCTTLLASHRFSTVRRAQRICVLDGGRVAELGSHDELMALGGRYASFYGLQSARFGAG
jgi:ATP-binding cassette subfamily B protein